MKLITRALLQVNRWDAQWYKSDHLHVLIVWKFVMHLVMRVLVARCNINTKAKNEQASRRHGSLASMSLCKYQSSAHLLKLTRTSVKLTGKLVCDIARLVSIMIIRDDVTSDIIRPRSTIRDDHIDTPYRGTLCSSIVQFWQVLSEKHFKEKSVTSSGHVTSSEACAIDSP